MVEPTTPKLLNAMRLKREVVKEGCHYLLVQLTMAEESKEVELIREMKEIVKEFPYVFQAPPAGLPPERDVGHIIP